MSKAYEHSSNLKKATFRKCALVWPWSSDARYQRKVIKLGSTKIDHELDVTRFLRNQMLIKILLKVSYSKMERYLGRRQHKKFVIDSGADSLSSSDTDSCDDCKQGSAPGSFV